MQITFDTTTTVNLDDETSQEYKEYKTFVYTSVSCL